MPAKNPTLTIYPDPRAARIAAWNSRAANNAVARYARLLREADLSALKPADWRYLADLLNSTAITEDWTGEMLAAEVADGDALEGLGAKWFGAGQARAGAKRLAELAGGLTPIEVCAMATAVEWFWAHHDSVNVRTDEWWTVEFRCREARRSSLGAAARRRLDGPSH